jgi:hypothetical protein
VPTKRENAVQRGRSHARLAVLGQVALLAAALVAPTAVSAATMGSVLLAPSVATVAYSDLVTFRGQYTCMNDAAGTCPTGTQSRTATFALRLAGGDTFVDVATVTTSFAFTASTSGCPATCSASFQVAWRAGRTTSLATVGPGTYDLRLTTSVPSSQPVLLNALTITREGTTTTSTGATAGVGGDPLALAATVTDFDRGIGTGNGIITPDANLGGAAMVTFELYDATNTNLVVGPVAASLSAGGLTSGSPSLTLPSAGGSFRLRTTYVGNGFYTTSADLDVITVTPNNTAPVLAVPTSPVVVEATSPVGASVSWTASATDVEDEPDPAATCDELSGETFPLGDTTVTCSVTDSGGLTDTASFVVRVVDTTDPAVAISTTESPGASGWFNAASNDGVAGVTVDVAATDLVGPDQLACTDNGTPIDGLASTGGSFVLGDGQHAITCTVTDGSGNDAGASAAFDVDQTAPTIGGSATSTPAATGWWNATTGAPTITFSCLDGTSGVTSCPGPQAFGEGAGQLAVGVATDAAGNVATSTVSGISVDLTAPENVTFEDGGLVEGGTYDFWFVPAGPTGCSATDDISGVGACAVAGYDDSVGDHALTGTATDTAGNAATASLSYAVRAWTLVGFAKPVEMTGFNSLKAGNSIQLKLDIFAGPTRVTTPAAVTGIGQVRIDCSGDAFLGTAGGSRKEPQVNAAGGGTLSTKWVSPDQPGTCWLVTLATADGSSLSAAFRLK